MSPVIIIFAVILFLVLAYLVLRFFKFRKKKTKEKKVKEKKVKEKKVKKQKEESSSNLVELKSSYVDVVDKFLFRKELKVLVLISRVLPKGYVVFPKIGLDTILEPVGKKDLYDSVKDENIDLVVFDELTMKPKIAIDIFDGSIGDEQVEIASPMIIKALEIAKLPLISFKVKTDYTEAEIKEPIYKALGITTTDNSAEKTE